MAKINKSDYEALEFRINLLEVLFNGGKGSGNWGHSGRKGKVGGSGKGGGIKGIADKSIERAKTEEPEVSKDLTSALKDAGAEFGGFDYRLKGSDSLQRKIKQDQKDSGSPRTAEALRKAAGAINDNLRYTALLSPQNYTEGYNKIKNDLESKGYEFVKVKNLMGFPEEGNPYRGVNAQVKNKNGYIFELQFHTDQSFDIKQNKIHKDYEIARNPVKYNEKERSEATKRMFRAYDSLELPKDVQNIKPFKK